MSAPVPPPARCPHCRAAIDQEEATSCWLCEQELGRCPHCWVKIDWPAAPQCALCGTEFDRPAPPPPPARTAPPVPAPLSAPSEPPPTDESPAPPGPAAGHTFGLGSLMLVIALIAACLGGFRASLGLGILTAILLIPPLVSTAVVARRRAARGRPLSASEKLRHFAIALAIVAVVAVAPFIVLFETCALVIATPIPKYRRLESVFGGLEAAAFAAMVMVFGGFVLAVLMSVMRREDR